MTIFRKLITRRQALLGFAVSALSSAGLAEEAKKTPDPSAFQSGDLLWPKTPGAFIPYDYRQDGAADADRERWQNEKAAFVIKCRSTGDPEMIRLGIEMDAMTYNEFRAIYLRDQIPGQITTYSLQNLVAVGHVAIIDIDSAGTPYVIEALWTPGVVRGLYSDWLSNRPGQIIWHGRLKGFEPNQRQLIAKEAGRYIGKPYDFWNFDLSDENGFYCSKLVWLSTMRALQFPIDGNPQAKRKLWLSPKQELYSKNIARLFDPGNYGTE